MTLPASMTQSASVTLAIIETEEAAPPSSRDKRREATRKAIEWLAIGLFEEAGYDQVTVADIAAKADISERTFFRYFAGKDDVLFATTDYGTERFKRYLETRPKAEDSLTAMKAATLRYARDHDGDLDLLVRRERLAARFPQIRRWERGKTIVWEPAFVEILRRRDPKGDPLRHRIIAASAVLALEAGAQECCRQNGAQSLSALVARAFEELGAIFAKR